MLRLGLNYQGGGHQSSLYEKILEVQPHFEGGQGGQAQYEMLNFTVVDPASF